MIDWFTDSHKRLGGGRTWWAHLQFTRINIEPTILRKKIEDLRDVGAHGCTVMLSVAWWGSRSADFAEHGRDARKRGVTRDVTVPETPSPLETPWHLTALGSHPGLV
jgi:hypothetical protein